MNNSNSVSEKAKQAINPSPSNGSEKITVPTTFKGAKSNIVKGTLEMYRAQIAQAIPKHLTADRVIQLATTLITRTPEIQECSTESLIGAVMQASILGFEPVQALGQCYMVPFNNNKSGKREIQFIIGYRGKLELARRSGQIKTIYAQEVYKNDEFSYELGLDPKLFHKPALEERGKLTHFYAVATFVNGGFAFEVMSKSDVDKIRDTSKAAKSSYGPWNNFYTEMGKKTVIHKLWKYLPSSVELNRAEVIDEKVLKPENFMANGTGEVDPNTITTDYEEVTEVETVAEEETIFSKMAKGK